jgi:hypothetical protein
MGARSALVGAQVLFLTALLSPVLSRFYIGYDKGDPWLDDAEHLGLMRAWFQEWITTPALRDGIHAKIVFATFENQYHRPGPGQSNEAECTTRLGSLPSMLIACALSFPCSDELRHWRCL